MDEGSEQEGMSDTMKLSKVGIKSSGTRRILDVEVPEEEVRRQWEESIGDVQRVAQLPGFRTGKVPRNVIEREFKKDIEREALRHLLSHAYQQAIDQEKLEPIAEASVSEVNFKVGVSLSFRAQL